MFITETSYVSIKDLSKINEMIVNRQFSEVVDEDIYCIVDYISIDILTYQVTLDIISKKVKLIDKMKDYNKVFCILSKNNYIQEIDLNIKTLPFKRMDGKKLRSLEANITFKIRHTGR